MYINKYTYIKDFFIYSSLFFFFFLVTLSHIFLVAFAAHCSALRTRHNAGPCIPSGLLLAEEQVRPEFGSIFCVKNNKVLRK